jgi:hypothetical protein
MVAAAIDEDGTQAAVSTIAQETPIEHRVNTAEAISARTQHHASKPQKSASQ